MPDAKSVSSDSGHCRQRDGDKGCDLKRRSLLNGLLIGTLACSMQRALAQSLTVTPAQTEGPFYPDRLPLDQDNDLVLVAGHAALAAGEITHLTGRILDMHGKPLRGVVIEIWQVDHKGHYIHSADAGAGNDADFQGFGRFETGQSGEYRFRTIKPVPYPGRTPHIHVKLRKGGRELLTTQLYVQGHPLNERDGILRSIRDPEQRASVVRPFLPSRDYQGELAARFDIVLGMTPAA
jgi:protocatechuate 3,4-dioxygenase beta subunit